MMANEVLSGHIGVLAKAEADGDYVLLRSALRALTGEELLQVQRVVGDLRTEVDAWVGKAFG